MPIKEIAKQEIIKLIIRIHSTSNNSWGTMIRSALELDNGRKLLRRFKCNLQDIIAQNLKFETSPHNDKTGL